MNELQRTAYLQAMGIDSYVSRAQLPGAAVTRRLAIVPVPQSGLPSRSAAAAQAGESAPPSTHLPGTDTGRRPVPRSPQPATSIPQHAVPRFSLAAIVAGDWLWLEELGGMPLATEQVQLVQAMAHALRMALAGPSPDGPANIRPDVTLFDWPIHNNEQLEQGDEAARAGVAGFVGRKLGQHQCRGLVLLGEPCRARIALDQLDCAAVVDTLSSAAILAEPRLKQQAWRDLLTLVRDT